MILGIIRQFNWVDIALILVFARVCYIAVKNGVLVELFKLTGTIFAIYIAMHYYTKMSDLVLEYVDLRVIPLEFLDFLFFVILSSLSYGIIAVIRVAFGRIVKTEAVPSVSKWGGLVFGIIRGFLLAGFITFLLAISSVSYLKTSAYKSYSGQNMFKVSPNVYSNFWYGFMSKIMTKEKFNKTVEEVEEEFRQ